MRLEVRRNTLLLGLVVLGVVAAVLFLDPLKSVASDPGTLEQERDAIAERVGQEFVEETFVEEHWPDSPDFQNRMIKRGEPIGTEYLYGTVWESSGYRFWTGVYFVNDENSSDLTEVFRIDYSVHGPAPSAPETFTAENMRGESSRFIDTSVRDVECRAGGCETYGSADGYEEGFLIFTSNGTEMQEINIMGCRKFPESPNYNSGTCLDGGG